MIILYERMVSSHDDSSMDFPPCRVRTVAVIKETAHLPGLLHYANLVPTTVSPLLKGKAHVSILKMDLGCHWTCICPLSQYSHPIYFDFLLNLDE